MEQLADGPNQSECISVRADGPPDWSSVPEEILCPLCDYNLRGLIEPRCPECGHRFTWPQVLTYRERVHPYLFEHHPQHNIRSFFQTVIGAIRPVKFWRRLQPTHPPHPKRLLLYWLLLATPVVLTIGVMLCLEVMQARAVIIRARQSRSAQMSSMVHDPIIQQVIAQYGSIQEYVNACFPFEPAKVLVVILRGAYGDRSWLNWKALPWAAAVLFWPWVTMLTLLIFRVSLAQARIKYGHVLRCVIYSVGLGAIILPLFIFIASHPSISWTQKRGH